MQIRPRLEALIDEMLDGQIMLDEAMAEFDVFFFEEPVLPEDPRALAEVAKRITIPIATGENLYGRHAFRDLGLARAADVWQPDTAMTGGITEMVRIAALASAMEVQLAPH